ncbi:esterase/lipase family protein [Hyalangium rubrum]|uniref:DUF676 domain-containing protein n=1 Tax=Hyalangium rubrum TaxID=3103134 RepID=A0ABU5GX29_9BACT|nr:hypothetical protein [Hyalangium sp. s54d21]MDY7225586.1 hypothetical protein [Hyalangium sp. s54d21]
MTSTTLQNARQNATRIQQLQQRLKQLASPTTVPTGILYGATLSPLRLGQSEGGAAPVLSQPQWKQFYMELTQGALPGTTLPPLSEVEARAARHREQGVIPLALGHFRYQAPGKQLAAVMGTYVREGGQFPEAEFSQPGGGLEEQTAFFASPLCKDEYRVLELLPHVNYGRTVRYLVPSDLVLTNPGAAPVAVEIDFGDGGGYRPVTLDQPIAVTYSSAGDKVIRVRARPEQPALAASCRLTVAEASAPGASDIWALSSPISFQNVTATGYAYVLYGAGHTQLTNPLIMAEGFPGGYSLDTLWNIFNEQNLATNLLAMGYDLVLVGFDDGTNYLEANAGVMIAAIQQAISQTSSSTNLVVGGASMGGLVARYALAYMEQNNLPHQTTHYVSYDTPHLGANVPVGVQYFVQVLWEKTQSAGLQQPSQLLLSKAAQEMLISWVPGPSSSQEISPLRTNFLANLSALGGFPKQPKLLGVSNGATDGTLNGTPPASQPVYEVNDPFFQFYIATSPGIYDSQAGGSGENYVVFATQVAGWVDYVSWGGQSPAYDSAPGGTSAFFQTISSAVSQAGYDATMQYANGCFVPTISALSMSSLSVYSATQLVQNVTQTPSDLDAWIGSANDPHVTITADTAQWLLSQLPSPSQLAVRKAAVG